MRQEFTLSAASPPLRVLYRAGAGSIHADIPNNPDATIVLYPQTLDDLHIIRTSRCGAGLKCDIENIPPGDYYAFAFHGVQAGALRFDAFIDSVRPFATSIRVGEGEVITLHLSVAPWPE